MVKSLIFISEVNFSHNIIIANPHLNCFRYKLVVAAPEPKKITSPSIANIQVHVLPSIFLLM